jgi:hypothetical protein
MHPDIYVYFQTAEGQWKDDKRHGEGKLIYVSGVSYEVRRCITLRSTHHTYIPSFLVS